MTPNYIPAVEKVYRKRLRKVLCRYPIINVRTLVLDGFPSGDLRNMFQIADPVLSRAMADGSPIY